MRNIQVDRQSLLPLLNRSQHTYAMFVRIAKCDMPVALVTTCRHEGRTVRVMVTYEKEINDVSRLEVGCFTLFLSSQKGFVCGVDLPSERFRDRLSEFLEWLDRQRSVINCEYIKENYCAVSIILKMNMDDLFVPNC